MPRALMSYGSSPKRRSLARSLCKAVFVLHLRLRSWLKLIPVLHVQFGIHVRQPRKTRGFTWAQNRTISSGPKNTTLLKPPGASAAATPIQNMDAMSVLLPLTIISKRKLKLHSRNDVQKLTKDSIEHPGTTGPSLARILTLGQRRCSQFRDLRVSGGRLPHGKMCVRVKLPGGSH